VRCFCCQDSGLVSNIYITEFVEIPDRGDILPFICQRENCGKGQAYLKAYEMSDQERDAYHNTQLRNGKDADGLPRPMKARDYQANFSTNLNQACCDWLHDRSYDDWAESIRSPRQSIIVEFDEAVERRKTIIARIKTVAIALGGLQESFDKFVKFYSNQDSIDYPNWEALSNVALEILLKKVEQKLSESDDF
jgi:hypothetical protein